MNSQRPDSTLLELGHLVRGWRTLALATTVGMLTGVALLQVIHPWQEVSAKLLVEPQDSALDGSHSSNREREFLPTQAEVMSSLAVISSAVRKSESQLSEAEVAIRVAEIVKELKVDPLAGTNILLVRYRDQTTQLAVEFVNALIDGYGEYIAAAELHYQQQMLASLKIQENEYQTQLIGLNSEYEQLIEARATSIASDANATGRVLTGLEESLAALKSRRMLLERASEQVRRRSQTILTLASRDNQSAGDSTFESKRDNAGYQENLQCIVQDLAALSRETWSGIQNPAELEAQLMEARGRVGELTVALGVQHPELRAARAAVLRYEEELRRAVQTAPMALQLALQSVLAEEESLQQRYDTHLRLARDAELMRLKEVRKLDEIDRLKEARDVIQVQLQQWQTVDHATASGRSGITVTVLESPIPAERSFAANPLIITGISGLLGLMLGVSGLVVIPQIIRMVSFESHCGSTVPSHLRVQESLQ